MQEGKGNSLEFDRVRAMYGVHVVLEAVSLRADPGELVAILGPNGAGKSTILRVATGLIPCDSGAVRIGTPGVEGEVKSLSPTAIARSIAVVSQETEVAYGFSVREVVAMGRAPHQAGWMRMTDADEAATDAALLECDLADLASRNARELSGGERKRVAIARALCQQTPILLLDEPTASLDVRHSLMLFDLLEKRTKQGLSCVAALHDLNFAARASRVVLLKNGRVIASGPPREVMTEARLEETFDARLYVGESENGPFFQPISR